MTKHTIVAVLSGLLLPAITGGFTAQGEELRTLFCPIVTKAPTIDGRLEEEQWSRATTIDQLQRPERYREVSDSGLSGTTDTDTVIRLMVDASTLYVGFVCAGPDGKPKNPQKRARDAILTNDNMFQVFVDLNHNHKANKMFAVDYLGTQADAANAGTGHKGGNDTSWNARWRSAVHREESSWSGEIAIPIRELTGDGIAPGTTFGINFVRRRPDLAYNVYLMTSPIAVSRFYWSYAFADLVCGPPRVVVSKIGLPVWRQGANTVELELRNLGDSTEAVEITARAFSNAGGELWKGKKVSVDPGRAKRVQLSGRIVGDWENKFTFDLTRAQTDERLYSATYSKLNFGPDYLGFGPKSAPPYTSDRSQLSWRESALESERDFEAVDDMGNLWAIRTSVDVRLQPDPFRVELAPAKGGNTSGTLRIKTELVSETSGERLEVGEHGLSPGSEARVAADTATLPDGGYVLRIAIVRENGEPLLRTGHYFVCVGEKYPGLKSRLTRLQRSIESQWSGAESLHFSRSSFMMLEYLVRESAVVIETGTVTDVFSTSAYRRNLARAQEFLKEAEKRAEAFDKGTDPLAGRAGILQRAYLSSYSRKIRPYTVFVPSSYDGSRPFPLVSYMLSEGPPPPWRTTAETAGRVRAESLALAEEKGFIMVWPTSRRLEAEANFFDVLPEMKKDYNIDEDRIYLMGVSGGGLASWMIGLMYPDQIAAICSISSVSLTTALPDDPRWQAHLLADERAAFAAMAPGEELQIPIKAHSTYYFPMNALHVPVLILHSDADTSTLVDVQARPMVKKMQKLGLQLKYVEYPGTGHGLGKYYPEGFAEAMDFFEKHRNVRHPRTINYSTPSIRYDKAYWIKIGQFSESGKFARVRAETKGNAINVRTENVAAFSVLRDEVVFDVSSLLLVIVDGQNAYTGLYPKSGGIGFVQDQNRVWQVK